MAGELTLENLPLNSPVAPLSGFLNIHKPGGLTSRQVVDRVARLVPRKVKVGHAGTLDPLATGVLVVCVGAATRLVPYVQDMRKTYRGRFLLGRRSTTNDIDGDVTEVPDAPVVTEADIAALLPRFLGTIQQTPPQFSAVHVGGQRAYELARRGEQVTLTAKPVEVYRIELLEFASPELRLEIDCGSGTYIRSLGRDLGDLLGCGAVMSELVRTSIGPFRLESAVDLDALTPETLVRNLQPPALAVADLPWVIVSDRDFDALRHGRMLRERKLDQPDEAAVALLSSLGELVGIARYSAAEQSLAPKQVFVS